MRKLWMIGCVLIGVPTARAGDCTLVDFETFPDGTATTDLELITDQYEAMCGVTFDLPGAPPDTGPRIAKAGPPQTAFQGPNRAYPECDVDDATRFDMPAESASVGCAFLTDDADLGSNAYTLRITYTTPVAQAGADLLDIDANEQWTITAKRENGSTIGTVVLGTGEVDGATTPWAFDASGEGSVIKFIEMEFTGTGAAVGLAFDNFFVSSTPDAVGACCLPDDVCFEMSAAECAAEGGDFTAEGVSCEPNPCPDDVPSTNVSWGMLKLVYDSQH